jgi:hypothetical protein
MQVAEQDLPFLHLSFFPPTASCFALRISDLEWLCPEEAAAG